MREYTIDKKNDGKRLDRWLSAELPGCAPMRTKSIN